MPGGDVKIIERFDCSGCGDVDTSKKVQVSNEGTIQGLSGRTLKVYLPGYILTELFNDFLLYLGV